MVAPDVPLSEIRGETIWWYKRDEITGNASRSDFLYWTEPNGVGSYVTLTLKKPDSPTSSSSPAFLDVHYFEDGAKRESAHWFYDLVEGTCARYWQLSHGSWAYGNRTYTYDPNKYGHGNLVTPTSVRTEDRFIYHPHEAVRPYKWADYSVRPNHGN